MDRAFLETLLTKHEGVHVDFKSRQYVFGAAVSEDMKSELLKDIVAFANVEDTGDRYIVIGAREARGQRAEVIGVASHLQDHELQQFVNKKTQRRITFAYEVVECDGLQLGVIFIRDQPGRPFYLKEHYGKLDRFIVYKRVGSSTDELSPDDLIEHGRELERTESVPKIAVSLVTPADDEIFVRALEQENTSRYKLTTRILNEMHANSLREVCDTHLFRSPLMTPSGEDYFSRLQKYLIAVNHHHAIGFSALNTGRATAAGVIIELSIPAAKETKISRAEDYFDRPPVPRFPSENVVRGFSSKEVSIKTSSDGAHVITWKVEKLIPGRVVDSKGFFVFFSGKSQLQCSGRIFAENLPAPVPFSLSLENRLTTGTLDPDELEQCHMKYKDRRYRMF
jgi:hypothetical protein